MLSNFGLVCPIDYVNNEDTEKGNLLGTHVSHEGVWIINSEPGNCVIKIHAFEFTHENGYSDLFFHPRSELFCKVHVFLRNKASELGISFD